MINLYFKASDENQDGIEDCIVVRDNGEGWTTGTWGVGNYQGAVVCQIPFQSAEGRVWAIEIAKQIVAAGINTRSLVNFDELDGLNNDND